MSRIDVHHHVYAPILTQAINDAGGDPSGWFVPEWTVEKDRELCVSIGVKTAILSATAPGPEIKSDPVEAAKLARALNEFNAQVRDNNPEHYGFFASVPSLLDTERCLEEIRYTIDVLKADGVILMTRYGADNHYLGHADFKPVWQELNKRSAVVFVHPTHSVDTHLVDERLPQPMIDYPHETGRTAFDLIVSGMLSEHAKNCKIVLSHAGGTLPMLLGRVAGLAPHSPWASKTEKQILDEASWFYYDTALSSSPGQLDALLAVAPENHILFGSDYPNAPPEANQHFAKLLSENQVLSAEQKEDIDHRAAEILFPRLNKA